MHPITHEISLNSFGHVKKSTTMINLSFKPQYLTGEFTKSYIHSFTNNKRLCEMYQLVTARMQGSGFEPEIPHFSTLGA